MKTKKIAKFKCANCLRRKPRETKNGIGNAYCQKCYKELMVEEVEMKKPELEKWIVQMDKEISEGSSTPDFKEGFIIGFGKAKLTQRKEDIEMFEKMIDETFEGLDENWIMKKTIKQKLGEMK